MTDKLQASLKNLQDMSREAAGPNIGSGDGAGLRADGLRCELLRGTLKTVDVHDGYDAAWNRGVWKMRDWAEAHVEELAELRSQFVEEVGHWPRVGQFLA